VDLKPEEILLKIIIPTTARFEFVKEFKQAPRRDDDIAIVNAGMRVRLAPVAAAEGHRDDGCWVVEDVSVAYGGVAPKSIMAPKVMAGKKLCVCLAVLLWPVLICDNGKVLCLSNVEPAVLQLGPSCISGSKQKLSLLDVHVIMPYHPNLKLLRALGYFHWAAGRFASAMLLLAPSGLLKKFHGSFLR
jgi:hypothetical protein